MSLHVAAVLFPLDYQLRRLPSEKAIANVNVLSPQFVLDEIEEALKSDPFARDLRHDRDALIAHIQRMNDAAGLTNPARQ